MGGVEDTSKTLVDPPLAESEWAPSVAGISETPVFAGAAAEPRVSKTLHDREIGVAPTRPELQSAVTDQERLRARGARRPLRGGGLHRDRPPARDAKASTARTWMVGVSAFAFGIALTAVFFSLRSPGSARDDDAALIASSAAPRVIPPRPVVSPVVIPAPRLRPEIRDELLPAIVVPPSPIPPTKPLPPRPRVPPSPPPHPSDFEF